MTTEYKGFIVFITCATEQCHARFGIDESVDSRLRKTHESFYCPFGHTQSYPHKTDEETLRERIQVKDRTIASLESEIKKLKRKRKNYDKN